MTPQRPPSGRSSRLPAAVFILACCALLLAPSCVYFNTYYNAQKYFRQAEKARKKQEQRQPTKIGSPNGDPNSSAATASRRTVGRNRRTSRSGGSAKSLYDKAARKASLVLEEYESREDVDEGDLIDDAMFLMGRSFYWQGDYKDAAQSFNDLETNFPKSEFAATAKYWRGLSYEGLAALDEAEPLYRSLMTEGGEELAAKAALRLGEMAFQRKDYGAAIQEFRVALEAFPDTDLRPTLWVRMGEAHRAVADPASADSALAAFDHALSENPSDAVEYNARLNRGSVLYQQGQAEEALQGYRALLGESRFRVYEGQTRLLLGQFYQDQQLLEEALDEYTRVRDDFPLTDVSAMALYRTGLLYLQERSERERAREYLDEVLKEKRGSEGAILAQEMLRDFVKLDRLRREIHRADSLAWEETAKSDSLAAGVAADSTATAAAVAGSDSTAGVAADSTATAAVVAGSDSTAGVVLAPAGDLTAGVARDAKSRTSQRTPGRPRARSRGASGDGDRTLLESHFAVAEMYRDRLVIPDSAAFFYAEILRRFPESNQIPRALYSLASIRMGGADGIDAARPDLEKLIESFPGSEHANAARRLLGYQQTVTAEDQASSEFVKIEEIRLRDPSDVGRYIPLMDELSRAFPQTLAGARAAFVAAWTYENVAPVDTVEAERRFSRVLSEFPDSPFAKVVRERQEARSTGMIVKLERQLRTIDRGLKLGERIELIAVEPDSADSVMLSRKHMGFALRAHRHGRLDEASEFYELSLDQQLGNPLAYYGLGEIAWEEGYFEEALEYYRESLHYGKRIAGIHYRLFAHHTEEGREDSANHYLREVVRRDRSNEQVQELLDEFSHLSGAEAENLELSVLESLDLSPPDGRLDTPRSVLGLTQDPMVRSSVAPTYPVDANGDSAEVILDILIDADGLPETIEVFEGDEPLAAAAVEAARQYVFYPAERAGGDRPYVWVELAVPVVPPALPVLSETASRSATPAGVTQLPDETDSQTDSEADLQSDSETDLQSDSETDSKIDSEVDLQTDSEADSEADLVDPVESAGVDSVEMVDSGDPQDLPGSDGPVDREDGKVE